MSANNTNLDMSEINTNKSDVISIQGVEDTPVAPPPADTNWFSLMPMVLIFILFYFLLIRPQEKKRREHENFITSAKKGEEIVTNSGFFGRITKINDSDNTIIVELTKGVEVKMLKSSISDITSRTEVTKKKEKPEDKKLKK